MTNLLCIDTETDGVSPHDDHIVTLTILLMNDEREVLNQANWMFDFGGEIPEGASAVHGISTDEMREKGLKGPEIGAALRSAGDIIAFEVTNGTPLCLYNGSFDLTLLVTEARRHLSEEQAQAFVEMLAAAAVVDPLVIWKWSDKYRKGKRTLTHAAEAFGIEIDESKTHDATYDCWLAGNVAFELFKKYPQIAPPHLSFRELHNSQIDWKSEQAASLQSYFRRNDPSAVVSGQWPIQERGAA